MGSLDTLISDLALLLVVAGITTLLCRKFNQPSVLGYILAGFLIGPVISFIPTLGDIKTIDVWAEIGVIFLMFGIGLEFSLHKLGEVGTSGIVSSLIHIGGMMVLGYFVGILLGWGTMNSIFLGGMLSMSSTMITIKAIEDLGMKDRNFVRLAVGILVIEDIVGVFMMVILSTISVSQNISGMELAVTIGKLLFYLTLWLLLGIYLVPSFLNKTLHLMTNETMLVVSLGICFGMVWLADALGFSSSLGAFIAGSILAGTVYGEKVEHLITPCKDLFGAVFFVSVGLKVVPSMLVEYAVPILVLTIVTIVGKLILLIVGMLAAGEDLETAVYGATSQTQIGEFSFILANLGTSLKVTGAFLYPVVVAVSVITTFTTPYLIKMSEGICAFLQKMLPDKVQARMMKMQAEKATTDELEDKSDWTDFLKNYIRDFALYGILMVGFVQIGVNIIWPFFMNLTSGNDLLASVLSVIITYVLILPLVPPLLFFRHSSFTALWLKHGINRVPLMVLIGFRIAIAIVLISMPLVLLMEFPLWLVLLITIPVTFGLSKSDWLIGKNLELEAQFLANFNQKKLQDMRGGRKEDHSWLDEQLYVESYYCTMDNAASGKSLTELMWGQMVQVNVIKIIRGRRHINIPEGHERLQGGDRVYILGTPKALENFALMNQTKEYLLESEYDPVTLREFIAHQENYSEEEQLFAYAVELKPDSPMVGGSIRESGIKSAWNATLLGVEREMLPLPNPGPSFVLNAGDLLWVLGTHVMGEKLVRQELL